MLLPGAARSFHGLWCGDVISDGNVLPGLHEVFDGVLRSVDFYRVVVVIGDITGGIIASTSVAMVGAFSPSSIGALSVPALQKISACLDHLMCKSKLLTVEYEDIFMLVLSLLRISAALLRVMYVIDSMEN